MYKVGGLIITPEKDYPSFTCGMVGRVSPTFRVENTGPTFPGAGWRFAAE